MLIKRIFSFYAFTFFFILCHVALADPVPVEDEIAIFPLNRGDNRSFHVLGASPAEINLVL